MNEQMIEKRNLLRTLSNAAIQAAENLNINPDDYKVNDLIMKFVYNPDNKYSFNSFMGWKFEGYTIKKGAKAYLFWGQPINKSRVNKTTGEFIQGNDNETEPPYFPIAYLFRDDQVIKSGARQKQPAMPEPEAIKEPFDLNF